MNPVTYDSNHTMYESNHTMYESNHVIHESDHDTKYAQVTNTQVSPPKHIHIRISSNIQVSLPKHIHTSGFFGCQFVDSFQKHHPWLENILLL